MIRIVNEKGGFIGIKLGSVLQSGAIIRHS